MDDREEDVVKTLAGQNGVEGCADGAASQASMRYWCIMYAFMPCMNAFIHVCLHMYVRRGLCVYVMHACMHVCVNACICVLDASR